ncbi:MAG: 30S ribosomal protein S8e [Candidatus Aenigmarchaeota archaeon ex4484_52]|nr:MAG: 30S ribosomal protein S8e [Candidatus Aenigmarchaeota archaeon ex4484_52]
MKLHRKKRKSQMGSLPIKTIIAPIKLKQKKILGGGIKKKIISTNIVNIIDKKNKTTKKEKIISILKNNANQNFVIRSIITKGAIVKTNCGNVKITSRPGQSPVLNGVLIE